MMNTTDTARMVDAALAGGYGLYVELDSGYVDLFGSDLAETWGALAPGEAFDIVGVIMREDTE